MPAVSADSWRRVGAVAVMIVAAMAVVVFWARPAHEPARLDKAVPVAVTSLNPTDLAFLQLMISLDNSALPLFGLMQADPAVQAVATSGADGHRGELTALRAALTGGGGIEDGSQHAGHDLPGMVLEGDLAAVRAAAPAQRPAEALKVLRDHLAGTTSLATSEGKAGFDPATKAAAAAILDTHTKLLAQLPVM